MKYTTVHGYIVNYCPGHLCGYRKEFNTFVTATTTKQTRISYTRRNNNFIVQDTCNGFQDEIREWAAC
jgi:hypothetical protein